jgi:cytochrome c peroxidase
MMKSMGTLALLAVCALAACGDGPGDPSRRDDELRERFALAPLGETPRPPGDGRLAARVELGRLLFFDPILSGEKDVACGTCHHPDFAFADGRQLGAGASGTGLGPSRIVSASSISGEPIGLEGRNSPTVFNAAFNADGSGQPSHLGLQFWDGRAVGLEAQARGPLASRTEMAGDAYPGEAAEDSVVARLRAVAEYVARFEAAFPAEAAVQGGPELITIDTYARAVAAYERELVTRSSPFDRYARGDDDALTAQQKLGLELFFTKAKCANCHAGPMFSDFAFRVVGVPQEGGGMTVIPGDDAGREEHTLSSADRYAFRTPTLRNAELTAPYMHDGVFATLEEVVRFYDLGGQPRHPGIDDAMLDPLIPAPLGLTDAEVTAVVQFMKALTDRGDALDAVLTSVPASVPSGLTPVFGVAAARSSYIGVRR